MKNILVIADLPENKPKALNKAVQLAKQLNANVEVISFVYEKLKYIEAISDHGEVIEIKQKLVEQRNDWLKQELAQYDFDPSKLNSHVIWEKNIGKWIVDHTTNQPVDLIIKTGHPSEGIFYTPTDWQLLRRSQYPVLLVAERKWKKQHNILVALDLSSQLKAKQSLNLLLLQQAKQWQQTMGGKVYLTFCLPISPLVKAITGLSTKKAAKQAEAKYSPLAQSLVEQAGLEHADILIRAGEPDKVIASVAADVNAGLTLIGTVGRKGLKGKLLGNTAEQTLALLKTDVLAVQP